MQKEKFISVIVDIASLIIGIASLCISIYYSFLWLYVYSGFPFLVALTLSITYIVFLNIIFESSISFFQQALLIKRNVIKIRDTNTSLYKRGKRMQYFRIILGVFIMCMWAILTSYSMMSTVAGQYGQLVKIEDSKENQKDSTYYLDQLQIIEEQISFFEKQTSSYNEELELLIERTKSIVSIEDRYKYKNTTGNTEERIDELRKTIEKNNNKIVELIQEKRSIKKEDNSNFSVDSGSVYTYFSKITGFPELLIQLVLSLFPSIFIDIIAPVSFAIFIYRKKD